MIEVELIEEAAGLHDVGKFGVPDAILLKPGKPPEEFEVVKTHTSIGARLLSGSRAPLLRLAEMIAWAHHERWDGTGYAGMSGQGIPLSGRITAVADVFALTHDRPYKSARSVEEALSEIGSQRGRQFDPQVVDAFLKGARGGERSGPEKRSCPRPIGGNLPRLGTALYGARAGIEGLDRRYRSSAAASGANFESALPARILVARDCS